MMISLRLLAIVLLAMALVSCGNDRAERTARIRNLSQPELVEIYSRLDELQRQGATMTLTHQQIPSVVARLEPEGVMIRGNSAWIHVAGAFDDKVYVFVNGLGETQGEMEIVLDPGEAQPRQVLWQQSR